MIVAVDRKPFFLSRCPTAVQQLSPLHLYYCQLMFNINVGKYLLKRKGKAGDRGTGATLMILLGKSACIFKCGSDNFRITVRAILRLSLDALGSDFMESISDVSVKSEDTQIQTDEEKPNG